MTTKIHPTLVAKLKDTQKLYEKVTAFAELLPPFSEKIIDQEYTIDQYCNLGNYYGKLPLSWGIKWLSLIPTNYPKPNHNEVGFVNIYINCTCLFGDDCYHFAHTELDKILPTIECHFYDSLNTNFYFLPHEAEEGLKKLELWYNETKSKCAEYLKQKRKAELERELEELK